jgi:hypothetical protein
VEVGYLDSFSADYRAQFAVAGTVPDCGPGQDERVHAGRPVVVNFVTHHVVAVSFQERSLSSKDLVFTTGLLIPVVS